ncbi:MAG: hypothetical protein AB7H92_19420 [Microbacteriaceae bacterium]
MPRIRSIKPDFFTSEDVSELPLRARLTWIGLWTHCDDQGRAKDNVKRIKAAIWALDDVSLRDVEEDLATLAENGRITRYEVDGGKYLAITNWRRHQYVPKATASVLPPPPDWHPDPPRPRKDNDSTTTGELPEPSGTAPARKGKERKGQEGNTRASARPAPTCDRHPHGTPDNCGACGAARRAHDAWSPPPPPPVAVVLAEIQALDEPLHEAG